MNSSSFFGLMLFVTGMSATPAHGRSPQTAFFPKLADQAEFILYVENQPVLTNRVVWKARTSFHSSGEGRLDGEHVRMSTAIQCDDRGRWTSLQLQMPIHSTAIYRTGDQAQLVQPDGTTNSVTLRPGTLPFPGLEGLNLFAMYYDDRAKGVQILPVVVPHKKPREISVRFNRSFKTRIQKTTFLLREFEMILGDVLTATVLLDGKGRLIRSEMPSEKSVFIRKEFLFLKLPDK